VTSDSATTIREQVSKRYGEIAQTGGASCCGDGGSSDAVKHFSQTIGYSEQDLAALPEGANLGLGCGNPTTITMIREGWTVVDLGSGAGIDCFLASQQVGPSGKVIGVDMTDAMLEKAQAYAREKGYDNVEFRKGHIEELPLEEGSVDLVMSNCVINLSPHKQQVFSEISRVLKPGGMAAISDIVLLADLPDAVRNDLAPLQEGAELVGHYLHRAFASGLDVERAKRKGYDVMAVLGCSPDAGKLIENLPKDFDSLNTVASLDVLLSKPREVGLPVREASACCGGDASRCC